MAILSLGLNAMVDGIGQKSGLYLHAHSSVGSVGSAAVTFGAANGGVADISGGNRTITIPTDTTITLVYLTGSATPDITMYASYTIPNGGAYFPNGGDLIISSYELSVVSS